MIEVAFLPSSSVAEERVSRTVEVTRTVHALIGENADQLARVWVDGRKTIFLQRVAR